MQTPAVLRPHAAASIVETHLFPGHHGRLIETLGANSSSVNHPSDIQDRLDQSKQLPQPTLSCPLNSKRKPSAPVNQSNKGLKGLNGRIQWECYTEKSGQVAIAAAYTEAAHRICASSSWIDFDSGSAGMRFLQLFQREPGINALYHSSCPPLMGGNEVCMSTNPRTHMVVPVCAANNAL